MIFKKTLILFLIAFVIFGVFSCSQFKCNSKNGAGLNNDSFNSITNHKIYVLNLTGTVSESWADNVEKILEKAKGSPVILSINSPGGNAGECFLVENKIGKLMKKFHSKVYVYTDYGIFSGAYLFSMPCDYFVVAPYALVGSIGVIYEIDIQVKRDSIDGIQRVLFKSGKMKWTGSGYEYLTEEERNLLQNQVDYYFTLFINEIIKFRGEKIRNIIMPKTGALLDATGIDLYLRKVCDGRVYTPPEALTLGLIDSVMYWDDLITKIKVDNNMLDATIDQDYAKGRMFE